jgi:hypothetical protein
VQGFRSVGCCVALPRAVLLPRWTDRPKPAGLPVQTGTRYAAPAVSKWWQAGAARLGAGSVRWVLNTCIAVMPVRKQRATDKRKCPEPVLPVGAVILRCQWLSSLQGKGWEGRWVLDTKRCQCQSHRPRPRWPCIHLRLHTRRSLCTKGDGCSELGAVIQMWGTALAADTPPPNEAAPTLGRCAHLYHK